MRRRGRSACRGMAGYGNAMRHLITDAMLEDASRALTGHGTQADGTCMCGHDETPVPRHLAQVVADSITPALTEEVMALLSQVMAEPAPSRKRADVLPDNGVDLDEGGQGEHAREDNVKAPSGTLFRFTGRPRASQPRQAG